MLSEAQHFNGGYNSSAEVACSIVWGRINDKNEVFALRQRKCNETMLNKEAEITQGTKASVSKPISRRLGDCGCH